MLHPNEGPKTEFSRTSRNLIWGNPSFFISNRQRACSTCLYVALPPRRRDPVSHPFPVVAAGILLAPALHTRLHVLLHSRAAVVASPSGASVFAGFVPESFGRDLVAEAQLRGGEGEGSRAHDTLLV